MKRILIVAAHPDDEALGMGGTIGRFKDECEFQVLFMTDGVGARGWPERWDEVEQACALMGVEWSCAALKDNMMDTAARLDVIRCIENVVNDFKPDTVFTHHAGDLNIDHRITHEATLTACRSFASQVKRIYAFEVLSSTECGLSVFDPQHFIEISILEKLAICRAYRSEMRDYPHPRSIVGIDTLARYRGMQCRGSHAEGFEVIREVI